jgi:hypothetical protein
MLRAFSTFGHKGRRWEPRTRLHPPGMVVAAPQSALPSAELTFFFEKENVLKQRKTEYKHAPTHWNQPEAQLS